MISTFVKSSLMLSLLFTAISIVSNAQDRGFHLTGNLSGNVTDSVVVSYSGPSKKRINQVSPVRNGRFEVTGDISYPVAATIYFKNIGENLSQKQIGDRVINVYLEPRHLQLVGNPDAIASIKLYGSITEDENQELKTKTSPIENEMKFLSDEYAKEKVAEKAAVIREKFAPYNQRIKAVTYQFFLDHPKSFVTSDRLMFYVNALSLDSIRRVYDGMTSVQHNTPGGLYVGKAIDRIEAGLPGKNAVSFAAIDLKGKLLSLKEFEGCYVLLDFWASWCIPCRKGNPHLKELYQKYKSHGLDVIGIASDDSNPAAWRKAITTDGIDIWHHVLAGRSSQTLPQSAKDISEKYGVHTLPTKILIDPQGKIIGRYGDSIGQPEEELDKMLAILFK